MGQVASIFGGRNGVHVRQNGRDEEDPEQQLAFSNTTGSYFGSHFLMCGCRFEVAKPEAYLFGENSDLDQLGTKALNFPYPINPPGNDEIRPLNLLVNIRKESVKFIRVKQEDGTDDLEKYRLSCVLDCDVACVVQVHFHAKELHKDGEISFNYRHKRVLCSEQYRFDVGSNQLFSSYVFDSKQWDVSELSYTTGLYFPFVISITTEGIDRVQMQSTLCTIEEAKDTSKSLILKPLRQKIVCDGVSYLLQEIFGIENKDVHGNDGDDSGLECIICMSDIRDTVILPCRHLCICSNCAEALRYKANNCPICRAPFRALIRLRAHRQLRNQIHEVSLIEGLNGSHGTSNSNESTHIRESSRRKRRSGRNRAALHQVLTMEQLGDEKPLDAECIEMTYLTNEDEEQNVYVEDVSRENQGFRHDSSSSSVTAEVRTGQSSEECQSDENGEEPEQEETENVKRENRRSLQTGSRNSSSQLLEK